MTPALRQFKKQKNFKEIDEAATGKVTFPCFRDETSVAIMQRVALSCTKEVPLCLEADSHVP